MAKTLKTKIIIRNDSTSNWEAVKSTAILEKGEMGVELTESGKAKIKVGDGATTWANLPYAGGDEAKTFHVSSLSEIEDTELNVGDTAVVKTLITGDKYSYTGYVWDGSNWAAMDGNYSADNVYFSNDLTITANVGVQTIPSTGSKTLDTTGKNVKQVFDLLFASEKNPTTTQPTAKITSSNIGAKEVGTNIAVAYKFETSAGSYTYGPATGVTFSDYNATFNGETLTTSSGTFASVQVTDNTNLTITGSCNSSEGATPVTNLGNEYAAGKIAAKEFTGLSKGTLSGYRGWFQGCYNGTDAISDPTAITSAALRAFGTRQGSFSSTLDTVGVKQIYWAAPKGLVTEIAIGNSVNGAPLSIKKVEGIMVEGANGYTAAEYDLFYVNEAAAHSGAESWNVTVTKA